LSKKRVTILGSTGSIGRSALSVIRHFPERFEVAGLAARSNVDLLAAQAAEFAPKNVALVDPSAADAFSSNHDGIPVRRGIAGVEQLARDPADLVLCAMVGAAGLTPLVAALEAGSSIALANKEPLVMAGPLIMEHARRQGVDVLPVDSEHSAIFQCLSGHKREDVYRVYLTASGGPFYRRDRASLASVSPGEAANHPTWDMGRKISVDSATLMNKGLEVVEAMWLFGLELDQMAVVIHPQSIVHSLVEYADGNLLAHLGPTDMRFPIQFALTWPERLETPLERLDLTEIGSLTFDKPDFSDFPCLRLALEAARQGGTAPATLNAANETAVEAFCAGRLGFTGIPRVVEGCLELRPARPADSYATVQEADSQAREEAERLVASLGD
jgi:1-deoxy-D-xylulose-5-phosphate reductoisomerase